MPEPDPNPMLIDPRALLDLLPGRVYVVDGDYRIVFANQRAREYVGADPCGRLCHQALAGRDSPCRGCKLERVLAGEVLSEEVRDPIDDRWYRNTHRPLQRADGSRLKLTLVDEITGRKRAERALAHSEAKYRTVFDTIDDGVVIHDAETGDMIEVNQRVREMSGLPFSGPVKTGELDTVGAFDQAAGIERIRRAAAGQPQQFEWLARRPDGGSVWMEVTLRPAVIEGRTRVVAVVRDITRRKEIEIQLRDSEERYRMLIENLDDTVFSLDPEANFTYISESITRVAGYRPDEVVGRSFTLFVEPEYVPGLFSNYARCLQGERTTSEFVARAKDGTTRVVRTAARGIFRDGKPIGASGVMTDLTDLRRTESEKSSLEEQLRHSQKMEALGRLAGGVAHDFNNLLFVILNHARFVQEGQLDDRGRRSAQQIERAAERGAELTHKLLAISRRRAPRPKVIDLNEQLDEMGDLFERIVGEDIAIQTRRQAGLGLVEADPAHVSQVLMNLVANARDAMPQGGRLEIATDEIRVDPERARAQLNLEPGRYIKLTVQDTGSGMPASVSERAFEPFFTTKPGGQSTGLGLSTVYSAVHQAGGHIELDSEPDVGTTVRVYLPCTDNRPHQTPPRGLPRIPAVRGKTALVVEDQAPVRELVADMLRELGAAVIEADGPEQALERMARQNGTIELLVTDVRMPGMSGPELARRLRAERPAIRVLFMSGWAGEQEEGLERGAPLLTKPFRADDLLAKLAETLSRPTDR
jgi:PAS domain S-box-containing protein